MIPYSVGRNNGRLCCSLTSRRPFGRAPGSASQTPPRAREAIRPAVGTNNVSRRTTPLHFALSAMSTADVTLSRSGSVQAVWDDLRPNGRRPDADGVPLGHPTATAHSFRSIWHSRGHVELIVGSLGSILEHPSLIRELALYRSHGSLSSFPYRLRKIQADTRGKRRPKRRTTNIPPTITTNIIPTVSPTTRLDFPRRVNRQQCTYSTHR